MKIWKKEAVSFEIVKTSKFIQLLIEAFNGLRF